MADERKSPDELDRRISHAAIRLGAGALGTTWPNPAVGAIVVRDGQVVGRGRTAPGGRPHAEVLALAMAGEQARGATLYVSLEPCSHFGRTPPCADAIVAAGIERVVAAGIDPDPRVAGMGFQRLRDAGLAVDAGILPVEAKHAHAGHLARTANGRPHVALKLAVSADDAIGRDGEGNLTVSGAIARRHVHAMRARYGAILVGSGTIDADDPQLTCRLPGLEDRSPVRVVLDSNGRLGAGHRIFTGANAPTWILQAAEREAERGHVRRFQIPRDSQSRLDLGAALVRLAGEGITNVLVEGGARVARSFLEADLVDEVLLFRNPVTLGGRILPALAGLPLGWIAAPGRFRRVSRRRFGDDQMTHYERHR